MKSKITAKEATTRRAFLGSAVSIAAWAIMSPRLNAAEAQPNERPAQGKPNSVFNGVRIGCITYSYRGEINSAEDTLKALIQDNLSEVEMMGGPIESFAGIRAGARGRSAGDAP